MTAPGLGATVHALRIQIVSHRLTEREGIVSSTHFFQTHDPRGGRDEKSASQENSNERSETTYGDVCAPVPICFHILRILYMGLCLRINSRREVSSTHLILPTTTRFCDLAKAHTSIIEKISSDAKRNGIQEWSCLWTRFLHLEILARSGTNG